MNGYEVDSRGMIYVYEKKVGYWKFEALSLGEGGGAFSTEPQRASEIEVKRARQQAIAAGMQVRTDESDEGVIMIVCPKDWDTEVVLESFALMMNTMTKLGGVDVNPN